MNSELVVGIDLGTTNSCIARFANDDLRVLENREGDYTTPSFVFFNDATKSTVGKLAKNMSATKPEHGIYGIKRFIGRQYSELQESLPNIRELPFLLKNKSGEPYIFIEKYKIAKNPNEISALILNKLRDDASEKLGETIKNAVITVPAHFNISQRKATLEAAQLAGFNVLKLLNEPTAAAVNYLYECKEDFKEKRTFLVYDFGGGTFDVALLEGNQGNFNIVATDGDSFLGGHDIDNQILNYVLEYLEKKYNFDPRQDRRKIRRLINKCVDAKETLSNAEEALIVLECFVPEEDVVSITLTRTQFERMINDLLIRTIDIVDACIKSANMDKDNIDDIILAGGSSRIPKVGELLSKYFNGKRLNKKLNFDECVAKGAALQAAILSKHPKQKVKHFKINEVTSSSLGIRDIAGKMDFIIKKNTVLPTKGSVTHTTIFDKQKAIALNIYEGEKLDARKNICLGTFKITDLTPSPPGKCKIKVIMSIDENGILTVTAKEKLKDNIKNLQIVYTKTNRKGAIEQDSGDEDDFLEFAKMYEYLITYCAQVEYNFNLKKISSDHRNVYERCRELKKEIVKTEATNDKKTLKKIGTELISVCAPFVKKYSFKEMPEDTDRIFKSVSFKINNLESSSDNDDDFVGTRKRNEKKGFFSRKQK